MKRVLFSLLWAFALTPLAAHSASTNSVPTPDDLYQMAAQAYDSGQVEDAITQYEELVQSGYRAPELFYNLGNAYYRAGDIGQAVLQYKRALQLAPRDKDIRHNLDYVAEANDTLNTALRWPDRLRSAWTRATWTGLATGAWWLLTLSLGMAAVRPGRRSWLWSAGVAGFILVWSLWGIYYWIGLEQEPEMVVTKPNQEALFAPILDSTAYFSVPVGSVGRIETEADGWVRIRVDGKTGWLRQDAVASVSLPGPRDIE